MRYRDNLYGEWELPEYLTKLAATREMVRLRNITQSVLPNDLTPFGPIPSRFHHGLGVARLAVEVLKNNPELSDYNLILPIAALLHDAGNSPLSHLGEHFLKESTGHDGESFLAVMLDGSETEKILKEYGIDVSYISQFVSGLKKPHSTVLNGSMDIDNIDNVGRHNMAAHLHAESFDALQIASHFRYDQRHELWFLCDQDTVWTECQKWQNARATVYHFIYSIPNLTIAMMVYRAVEIAFCEGELKKDFFFFNDHEAIAYLHATCNKRTQHLIEKVRRWQWYDEIVSLATQKPSEGFKDLATHWRGRQFVADSVCAYFGIELENLCAYVGRGNDKRNITVPFIAESGAVRYDTSDSEPLYRLKIWVAPNISVDRQTIQDFVSNLVHYQVAEHAP